MSTKQGSVIFFIQSSSSVRWVICGLVPFLPLDEPPGRSYLSDKKQMVPCLGIKTSLWSNNHTTPTQSRTLNRIQMSIQIYLLHYLGSDPGPRVHRNVTGVTEFVLMIFESCGFRQDKVNTGTGKSYLLGSAVICHWGHIDTADGLSLGRLGIPNMTTTKDRLPLRQQIPGLFWLGTISAPWFLQFCALEASK